MIHGWTAVYSREILILRRRLSRMISVWSVSPLLYLVAFGYAMGKDITITGHTYLEFLIPGLVAMSSMTQAFAISSEINISRFYWHIFEEFQVAPISSCAYVLGEVFAGVTRAFLAVIVILFFGIVFDVVLSYNLFFWIAIFLNSFLFSSLGVGLAMLVKSHADQALLSSFIITPMAFLGGTFFPLDRLPVWSQKVLFCLPLTHAAKEIRAASFGQQPDLAGYLVLTAIGGLLFFLAIVCVNQARD